MFLVAIISSRVSLCHFRELTLLQHKQFGVFPQTSSPAPLSEGSANDFPDGKPENTIWREVRYQQI